MADTGMNYLYTIGGYATLFGVGYAVYHVSTQKNKKKTGAAQVKTAKTSQPEPRKEDRKKKQRLESFTSEARPKASEPSTWMNNVVDSTPDDGPDNREFARQLSKAQEGTNFVTVPKESRSQQKKSVKQSQANVISGAADKKASNLAPAVSAAPATPAAPPAPEVETPVTVKEPEVPLPEARTVEEATGVSDMLEPTRAGPSVLRVTDTGRKEQKPRVAKAPEPVETKKQRQNRKKAEAAKAARQEAEKDRKVQEEKQRRQARIAEGRPAKDGSQFKAANGTSSAWTQGAPNGDAPKATTTEADALHQPLDTFEKPAATPAKKNTGAKADGGWVSSLPSEETQLEMLKDESDEWSTVKTKSAKKTSKKTSSTDSGDELSQSWVVAQNKQPAPEAKKAKPAQTQNYGAFSALTTGDEAEEDAEEEWDV